jgi:hypothetical protein
MLQLRNDSPFAAGVGRFPDPDGIDTLYAVVKGTFTIGATPTIVPEQPAVVVGPEYHGDDPATASMKLAPELGLAKPTADVLVVGHAYARQGRATTAMDVSVQVGAVSSSLRVYGDRVWEEGAVGYSASAPLPFAMMPLAWERSFGGTDEVEGERHEEPRNPVGLGFRKKGGDARITGSPLPNLERLGNPMMSWSDAPAPIGLGPVSPHWEPRRSYAGTYDDAWQRQRAPYLPADFDPRFLQCAPPELIAPSYFIGGEPVVLDGLSPEGTIRFALPRAVVDVAFVLDGTTNKRPAFLDTVLLDTDHQQFSLVWRAAFQCDKRALRVSEIRVALQGMY